MDFGPKSLLCGGWQLARGGGGGSKLSLRGGGV